MNPCIVPNATDEILWKGRSEVKTASRTESGARNSKDSLLYKGRTTGGDQLWEHHGYPQSKASITLGKLTPTEQLRKREFRKSGAFLPGARSTTPSRAAVTANPVLHSRATARGRSIERLPGPTRSKSNGPRPTTSTLQKKQDPTRPVTPGRGRSIEIKRYPHEGSTPRSRTTKEHHEMSLQDKSLFPSSRTDPTIFKASRSRTSAVPFGERESTIDMFSPKIPLLFSDAKKSIDEEVARQAELLFNSYKEYLSELKADEIPVVRDIVTEATIDEVSELGFGSATESSLQSEYSQFLFRNSQNPVFPVSQAPSPILSKWKSAVPSDPSQDSFDEFDPLEVALNTHLSHVLTDDEDDRYTMLSDENDAFNKASRSRLRSRERKEKKKKRRESRAIEENESGEWNIDSRVAEIKTYDNKRLVPTPKRRVTPGLAMGESRSIVDQAEEQLKAIQQKREDKKKKEKQMNKGEQMKKKKSPTGVVDYGIIHATRSAVVKIQEEKQAAVSKLQKCGSALLEAVAADKNRKPVTNLRGSPRNVATEAVKNVLHLHDEEEKNTFSISVGSSQATSTEQSSTNSKAVKPTPLVQADKKNQKGWFGCRRSDAAPRTITAPERNSSSISSWSRTTGSKSGATFSKSETTNTSKSMITSKSGTTLSKSSVMTPFFICGKKGRLALQSLDEDSVSGPSSTEYGETSSSDESNPVESSKWKKFTSFDEVIKNKFKKSPLFKPEFAIVEIGEDDRATTAHEILMNKNDFEMYLTSANCHENESSLANSKNTDDATIEQSRRVKDDFSVSRVELTKSFAEQLRKMRLMKKQKTYKVPTSHKVY